MKRKIIMEWDDTLGMYVYYLVEMPNGDDSLVERKRIADQGAAVRNALHYNIMFPKGEN